MSTFVVRQQWVVVDTGAKDAPSGKVVATFSDEKRAREKAQQLNGLRRKR